MLSVAKLLREQGAAVRFSSSNEVASYIETQGFECNRLPLADVHYNEEGGLAVRKTVMSGGVIMARAYRQLTLELGNLASFDPDSVISDSAFTTVLAARILGKRVITILNQLKIDAASAGGSVPHRLLSVGMSEGMGNMWGLSEEVLLPDLPPPYTISENNLWNANVQNVRYIGFLTLDDEGAADEAYNEFARDSRTRVFWQVSGPPKTRTPLLKRALVIAKELSDEYSFMITGGDPSASTVPVRVPGGWYYGWCTLAQHYFRSCDVVVSRAGHGTLAQSISSGKPSLLIPIPGQTEQEGNSQKAVKLGVALTLTQDALSPDSFREAIESLQGQEFATNVGVVSRIANTLDARKEILRALSEGQRLAEPV
jgi:UDP-N-acetylglucosamine--N-acetylmuramyl-(pentapeptide) pyrophosphoryl-undecaprenol N-acetylglucosamine transferase